MNFLRFFLALVFFVSVFTACPSLSSGQDAEDAADLRPQINHLRKQGQYRAAIKLALDLVANTEKTLGPDNPNTANALIALGNLYRLTGQYTEAEPVLKRALTIQEQGRGAGRNRSIAFTLSFIAMLYNSTGRYAESEPLIKRALDIRERAKIQHPEGIAFLLSLLAETYFYTGRQAEAEPLMKRTVEIWEKHDNYFPDGMAYSLTTIAKIYRMTGRPAEAEPLVRRSLEICEKNLGPNHSNIAYALSNLAYIYRATGRGPEAGPLYIRALSIYEKSLGPNHPVVSIALNNLGFWFGVVGRHEKADAVFKRAAAIQDSVRQSIFTLLTEKQKLSYMRTQEYGIHGYLSHTAMFPASGAASVGDTFDAWLRWKGSVIEAQGRYLEALNTSDDPRMQQKLLAFTEVNKEIARLEMSGPMKTDPDEYKRKMSGLQKTRSAVEQELMAGNREFLLQKKAQAVDVQGLSAMLPPDSVYLDFAKIRFFDYQKKKWAGSHYLLFIFNPGNPKDVRLLDIGPSDTIDRHINAYLKEIGRAAREGVLPAEKELRREAASLYQLLIKPVEPFLAKKNQIFVSPDGNLNLIPFEALVTPSGRHMIEDWLISYVGAGRDVVKFVKTSLKGGVSLIIADPDYDLGRKEMEKAAAAAGSTKAKVRSHITRDAARMHFDRLPDTKKEADAIEKILKDFFGQEVINRQDKSALEYVLFKSSSPKVLHLATHGYFLTQEETRESDRAPDMEPAGDQLHDTSVVIENPMIRSGVVLAGVNTSLKEGKDEGMVTAEKVLSLNLKGTDLVVLSACQTGVGDVQSGEGVFGLKRAFILSGAKTLVMSLWSVPSQETVELMTSFYTLISRGQTNSRALREAKLAVMKQKPNPFFWGAFVLTGSP